MARTSIWLIALITLVTTVLDLLVWNMVYHEGVSLPGLVQLSQIGRFIRTALLLGFLPTIMRDKISGYRLLSFAFAVAIIADFFLILKGQLMVGIAFFAVMQILLMIRHLRGFTWGAFRQTTFKLSLSIAMVTWAAAIFLLKPGLQATGLFLPVAAYGLLLILSVWAAHTSMYLQKLLLPNAKLAFYAMLFFLACDVTVGLGAIWEAQPKGLFIRAITGIFYGPCLILLGLSGIKKTG